MILIGDGKHYISTTDQQHISTKSNSLVGIAATPVIVAVWLNGDITSYIKEVALHRSQLVLCGLVNHRGMQTVTTGQLSLAIPL